MKLPQDEYVKLQLGLHLLLIVAAITVGSLISNLGVGGAAIAVLSATVLVLGTAAIIAAIKRREAEEIASHTQAIVASLIESFRAQNVASVATWLFSEEGLAQYEYGAGAKEVIIASADLCHDEPGGVFSETVKKSLAQGVKYTYVVPETPEVSVTLEDIEKMFATFTNTPRLVTVPPAMMDAVTQTNLAAYIFEDKQNEVFVELAVSADPMSRYWAKLHKDYAYAVIGRLRKIIQEHDRT